LDDHRIFLYLIGLFDFLTDERGFGHQVMSVAFETKSDWVGTNEFYR